MEGPLVYLKSDFSNAPSAQQNGMSLFSHYQKS